MRKATRKDEAAEQVSRLSLTFLGYAAMNPTNWPETLTCHAMQIFAKRVRGVAEPASIETWNKLIVNRQPPIDRCKL